MDAIEKRSRELYEAARGFYNATIGDPEVTIRCKSGEAREVVTAAANRCFLALLDQRPIPVAADNPQVVAPPAHGAHEVQPEAVDVVLDLPEPGERLAAADALEHDSGVRPGGDGEATADHSVRYLEMADLTLQWQPISSAPQDGTRLLGWRNEEFPFVMLYDGREWVVDLGERELIMEPTHWMPLPCAPGNQP